ncbi:unnamed protein product [Boreogadus saida]
MNDPPLLVEDDVKGGGCGLVPEANGTEPSPGPSGLTEGPKWQRPRITRSSFMKCCLVKWIIDSTTPQGPVKINIEERQVCVLKKRGNDTSSKLRIYPLRTWLAH